MRSKKPQNPEWRLRVLGWRRKNSANEPPVLKKAPTEVGTSLNGRSKTRP